MSYSCTTYESIYLLDDDHELRGLAFSPLGSQFTTEENAVLEKYCRLYASPAEPSVRSLHSLMAQEIEEINAARSKAQNLVLMRIPSARALHRRVSVPSHRGKSKRGPNWKQFGGLPKSDAAAPDSLFQDTAKLFDDPL